MRKDSRVSIAFFDAKPYDREYFDRINRRFGFHITYFDGKLSRETAHISRGYDVVCVFVNDTVDAEVARVLRDGGVKLVALRCSGYNNVELSSLGPDLQVVRVPAYSPHAVAEYALALMLTLNRKTHRAFYRTRDNNFSLNGLIGFDMHGKTAGIIGTGKIGRITAELLVGFGMRVLAHDIYPNHEWAADKGVEYVDKPELYRQADIISLHCPLTPENLYMINKGTISLMKPNAMIVNTGRGKLINSSDLLDALKNRKIAAAALDVYEEETQYFFEDHSTRIMEDDVLARLMTFPNVLVTSHQAFFTHEALESIAETTMENIRLFFDRGEMPNRVEAA
jgi:D-lactate dehydrogenase